MWRLQIYLDLSVCPCSMAALLAIGTVLMALLGRRDDIITTAITTAASHGRGFLKNARLNTCPSSKSSSCSLCENEELLLWALHRHGLQAIS